MKLLLLAMMLSIFGCGKPDGGKPEGAFRHYEYKSSTMRAYPYEYYRLEYSDEHGLTLSWARVSSPVTVIRVPESAVQTLTDLINEYRLYDLKDSYLPPFRVLDGISWHLNFKYEKGSVYTSGENAWPPKKMREGIEAVNAFFGKLIEASTEEDVILTGERL